MMQKLIKCAILGGLVLFVWGMISWAVFPWHRMNMLKFKDEQRVAKVINDNAMTSGLYVLPNMMDLPKDSEAMMEARADMRQGPFVFASVSLNGVNPNLMGALVKGFILKVVAAFLVAWLLFHTSKLKYNKKVGFVTVAGLTIAIMASLPYVIWFGFPASFAVACIVDGIVGWFLTGLVFGKMIK